MAIQKIEHLGLRHMPKILLSRNTGQFVLDSESDSDNDESTDFYVTEVEYTVHMNDLPPNFIHGGSDADETNLFQYIHNTYELSDNEFILNIEIMEYNIDTVKVKLHIIGYDD
jgi:hypothetical protein